MSGRTPPFPFPEFEPRWQQHWEDKQSFRTPNPGDDDFDASKPKYYVLDMFPYPSGDGLHVGHPEGYTATDILGRTRRKQGYNVLHPMGWDAFGLPAEQYAIKTGQHPRITTEANLTNFRRQLKALGFAYDWSREVNTTDPGYVRWTQWIFLQLYHSYACSETGKARPVAELEAKGWTREQIDEVRLAFVSEAPVNWSPDLGTVLANEEVDDWKEKGHTVERRPLRQWMLRITAFADRLIDDLDALDWPESIKLLQKNWIGRSSGAEVDFKIGDHKITVYTTRPDTLFGATYMVLAPEHALVAEITTPDQKDAVVAYQKMASFKSELDRTELAKEKTGVPTGATATNPVNGKEIPVWIADYVLASYGTGAIMAVPAHDERDLEFAHAFGLPIIQVVSGSAGVPPVSKESSTYFDPRAETETHRRRLPHWQQDTTPVFMTWRLADSLPQAKLDALYEERDTWLKNHGTPEKPEEEAEYHRLFSDKIDEWLDAGEGACTLKKPVAAEIVADALKYFDGDRYILDAFVVMPNHVHVLFFPAPDNTLADIAHSWKSYTAKKINEATGRSGELWQKEYFDRLIRDEGHFGRIREYIRKNPRKAGLKDGEFIAFEVGTGGTPALPVPATAPGYAVNSEFLNGLTTPEAKAKITGWLEKEGVGRSAKNYKLRDWLFSRQRYWGEPFPILWEDGKHHALPERELPLLQPEMEDFKPTGSPQGPLAKATDWIAYSETARRETNTMPQWAGSCWYYLRYCDPKNAERFISEKAEAYWMGANNNPGGVDLYVGGTEHAVLHLLYARFWHKVLFDLGHLTTPEPFQRLVNQGLIMGEDGQKMSKSRGNVVNPDAVVEQYGADSLRLYEMFMGPLEQSKPWKMKGVEGVHRFLARAWRTVMDESEPGSGEWTVSSRIDQSSLDDQKALKKTLHETIKKVGEDIDRLAFNTAISQMMVCTNALTGAEVRPLEAVVSFLHVLNPFAPHLTEELYSKLRTKFTGLPAGLLSEQAWPGYDEIALIEDEVDIVIQVNGKLRDKLTLPKDAAKETVEAAALASEKVQAHTGGKTVRKIIVVPGRLVNIVAN